MYAFVSHSLSDTVLARCLVMLGEGKCTSNEAYCMYVLVFCYLFIYFVFWLPALSVSGTIQRCVIGRWAHKELNRMVKEAVVILSDVGLRCRYFRDRQGEATKLSQDNWPEVWTLELPSTAQGCYSLVQSCVPWFSLLPRALFSNNVNIYEFTAFRVRYSSFYILNISSSIIPRRLTGLVRQVQLLFRDGSVVGNIVRSR